MKKVFASTDMVIHVWAQRSQNEGRNSTRSVFFNDIDTIYSYGHHFALATFVEEKCGNLTNLNCIINDDRYSVTTSSQQASLRQATRQYNQVFTTTKILHHIIKWAHDDTNTFFLSELKILCEKEASEIIENTCRTLAKRKKASLIEQDINHAQHLIAQLGVVMNIFKIIMDAAIIDKLHEMTDKRDTLLITYKEQIAAENKIAREKKKAYEADIAQKTQEALSAWLKGDALPWGSEGLVYKSEEIYLRVKGDLIETSHKAEFPIDDAINAFTAIKNVIKRNIGFKCDNANRLKLGNFNIDTIDTQGNVKAGCHYVKYAQIESIAKQLNILV